MSFNLIISDHKNLWSRKNNILIGDWCANNNNILKNKKIKKAKYHWDSKKKIQKDLLYLYHLYEFILIKLTKKLNTYHKKKFTKKCWEIILSKWLWFYIIFYFDRWEQVNNLKNKKKLFVKLLDFDQNQFIPLDSENFSKNIHTNNWNHFAFSKIIKFIRIIKYQNINIIKENLNIKKKDSFSFNIKIIFARILNIISSNKFYCLNVFPGIISNLIFAFSFQQFRSRIIFYKRYKDNKIDIDSREKNLLINKKKSTKFEKFIFENIVENLPKSYFENFNSINEMIDTLGLPKFPKVIMTASEHHYNDVFKIYSANKIMNKSKYYIFQHGGSYGSADLFPTEKFDIKIADKFFSWGWTNKEKKIEKFFCNRNFFIKKKIKRKKITKGIIIPYIECSLYPNNIASGRPRTKEDVKSYINVLNLFYRNLNENIKKESFFKSLNQFKTDYNIYDTYVKNSLKKLLKNIKFMQSDSNTYKFLDNFKLCVETLNSTGYLESLQLNLPTVVIFDKNFCDIRKNSKKDFDALKKVNILFENSYEAANFINKNYNNLEEWWNEAQLQKIRKQFCDKYARTCNTPTKEFNNILKIC